MAKRVAYNTLNASTIDILNVIRQNASYDYQQNVPEVTKAADIPKVGEVIYGTPAFANQFINALVNRIALVRTKSATFNNPYSNLKKGYLEYGETIEDIFVNIAKVVNYDPEKANQREHARTLPDIRTAFHVINWRVMYPVTIDDDKLRAAFLSMNGVQELIASIVDSVYRGAEYDEFLLFKYLLIKAVSHGKMYPVSIGDGKNLADAAVQFRAISNIFTFLKDKYNEAGVKNNTPKNRQIIFMDSTFNAQFDVNVLAAYFHMEKADFIGRLHLIDDFTEFDNDRFSVIRENSDGLEEVTADELSLMSEVKAILIDEEWFQVYDNNNRFTEKYIASCLYWNYFYHTWKIVSNSPFANAAVFVTSDATITLPASITVHIDSKDESDVATVLTFSADFENASLSPQNVNFVQTNNLVTAGIAVQRYGAVIIPAAQAATAITLVAEINGTTYTAASTINASTAVDATVTLNKA